MPATRAAPRAHAKRVFMGVPPHDPMFLFYLELNSAATVKGRNGRVRADLSEGCCPDATAKAADATTGAAASSWSVSIRRPCAGREPPGCRLRPLDRRWLKPSALDLKPA